MSNKSKLSKKSILELAKTSYLSIRFSFKHLPLLTSFAALFIIGAYIITYFQNFASAKIVDSLVTSVSLKYIDSNLLFWFLAILFIYIINSILNQLDTTSAYIYYSNYGQNSS